MSADWTGPTVDWRPLVRRHAERAGVDLPQATVDEMALHLDDLYAAARAQGLSDADARAQALSALDESPMSMLQRHASRDPRRPYTRAADDTARAATRGSFSVVSAIRLALRQFRQHPTFALVTVLVLGLGTGAATTVFTVVDAVVLRPLPYAAPDRLVTLWDTNIEKGLAHDPISPVNFMDYRALPVFSDAAAWWRPGVNLIDPGLDPVRVNTIEVSGNLFDVLGVGPQVGAGLRPEGSVLRAERARRRHQRSAVAHALQRRPVDHRPAAVAERHAVHRRRRDAAEVSLSRTTSTSGSGCAGT